ncbi:MAG: circadian clock protein KaiC [Candidatus Aminicenantes bacterium]|nr:circadian clock protein KaiC [Candidatus Aminicenantes bacterium]
MKTQTKKLEKVPTFIKGLDSILEGGLPKNRATLVLGSPGTGKTNLALEFLYHGASDNEPGIFLGFEETKESLKQNAWSFGWDLEALEKDNRLFIIEGRLKPEILVSGKFSLKPLLSIISHKAQEMKAKRLVIDALDVLLQLLEEPFAVRSELHYLNHWLSQQGLTTILTLKPREDGSRLQDFFMSIADCAIVLDARVLNQITTRRLRVIKYRGSSFGRNEYPFVITDKGLQTIPITSIELKHKPFSTRFSTGIERLDRLLDGGIYRASCTLIAGEPGTGKTLLTTTIIQEACRRGEKAIYVSFEESDQAIINNVRSAGVELGPYIKSGRLHFITAMPEATGAEEHLLNLINAVDQFNPQHVVIDAISACSRMGGTQAAYEYLMRALNLLKERGITILLVNQTSGSKAQLELSGIGISSMIDTVIFLSYVHGEGETNRTIQVLKSRGSAHSNQIRECLITDEGIKIIDAYVGEAGVLTGTARKVQEARDRLTQLRQEALLKSKELELARVKAVMEAEMKRLQAEVESLTTELKALKMEQEISQEERRKRQLIREYEKNHKRFSTGNKRR